MKLGIKSIVYQAIIEDKWLDISYVNRDKENTDYYIGIIDIDNKKGTITCDIFNPYKDKKRQLKEKNDYGIKIHRGHYINKELRNTIPGDRWCCKIWFAIEISSTVQESQYSFEWNN